MGRDPAAVGGTGYFLRGTHNGLITSRERRIIHRFHEK